MRKKLLSLIIIAGCISLSACQNEVTLAENEVEAPKEAETVYLCQDETVEIPVSYDLRAEGRVSDARSQGNSGTCWAHSVISSVESNLIINGYESRDVDMSENHLVYYSVIYDEDTPMESSVTDGFYVNGEKEKRYSIPYETGNSDLVALCLMATGVGPIKEELAPLDLKKESESAKIVYEAEKAGKVQKYMGDYLVTGFNVVTFGASKDVVKREILKYGAVSTASLFPFPAQYKLGDEKTGLYVKRTGKETNHVVSVIGWNDEFPKENFVPDLPENNGAWLIKDTTSISDSKYFWMSYEMMCPTFISVSVSPKTSYGSVMFYDSVGPSCQLDENYEVTPNSGLFSENGDMSIANVFTASEDNEVLAAGIFTLVPNQKVRVRVYKNPDLDIPDSGELVGEVNVVSEFFGYHVIDLPQSIPVSAGETFSIVADYQGDTPEQRVAPVEMPFDSNNVQVGLGEYFHTGSNPGESYAFKDGVWYDLSKEETAPVFNKTAAVHNAVIRALMQK